jgi:CRP-like cAMP-binding protein
MTVRAVVLTRAAAAARGSLEGARAGGAAWAEVLEDVPLFEGVSKRHLRKIASLTTVMSYPPGDVIVRAGAPGDAFYLLLDGHAAVLRPGGLPAVGIGPGDSFGEMALLDDGPRSATVAAESEVLCLRIGRAPFLKMVRGEPSVALVLLRTLAGRIRALQDAAPA